METNVLENPACKHARRTKWLLALFVPVALGFHILSAQAAPADPLLYVVNSTGDVGNGGSSIVCDDGTGQQQWKRRTLTPVQTASSFNFSNKMKAAPKESYLQ